MLKHPSNTLLILRQPNPPVVGELGGLWIDSDAGYPNLFQCTSLSPLTYTAVGGGGGGGAPTNASYVVLGTDATLTNERVLTAGANVGLVDGGAGAAITISSANEVVTLSGDASGSGATAIAVTLATVNGAPGSLGSAADAVTLTVNGKGLVTAAAATPIQIAESQVTGLVTDLATLASDLATRQLDIQFQDEGVNLGTAGTVTSINATGSGITASRVGDAVTLNVPGGGGGSFAATQVVVALPYPARRSQVVNVVDAAVAVTDKIMVTLAAGADSVDNNSNMTELIQLAAEPLTGSINFKFDFVRPEAGNYHLNYARAA